VDRSYPLERQHETNLGHEKIFKNSKQNPVSSVFILEQVEKGETEPRLLTLTHQESNE
jgi:hypothetical protein